MKLLRKPIEFIDKVIDYIYLRYYIYSIKPSPFHSFYPATISCFFLSDYILNNQ